MVYYLITKKAKCTESKADTQQHLHKRSAEAVVVGQSSMVVHFYICSNFKVEIL